MNNNHFFSKMLMILTCTGALAFWSSSSAWSQVATNYTFSQNSGTYTPITGGTVLATASVATTQDDAIFSSTIPFNFVFDGNVQTNVRVSTNGFMTFGTTDPGSTNYAPISTATGYAGAVAPFGRDLQGGYTTGVTRTIGSNTCTVTNVGPITVGSAVAATGFPAGTTVTAISGNTLTMSANATATGTNVNTAFFGSWSNIRVETLGSTPNRIYVVQWSNWKRFGTTNTTTQDMVLNFLVRLYEADNAIEIVYGNCSPGTTTLVTTNQVGLRGPNATFATNVNNRLNVKGTNDNWQNSSAGTANTSGMIFNNVAPANVIPNGLTYRWEVPVCNGTPNAGTAAISASSGCQGVQVTLSATGLSGGNGITYQWQSSPDGIGSWSDVVGATSTSFVITTVGGTTFYRLRTFCSNSGLENFTSNSISYHSNLSGTCICAAYPAIFASSTADEEITNVTVGSMNNSSTCATTAPGPGSILNRYSNYTSSLAGPTAMHGETVSFSLTQTSCGGSFGNGFQLYIDWNQDGDFLDAGEQVYNQPVAATGNHTKTGTFVVPPSATLGTTRMRVVVVEVGFPTSVNYAHTGYTWGETEDYCFTVNPAPACAGTPNAGTATISSATGCINTNFNLNATGISFGTGIQYQWQSSSTGSAPWTEVVGGNTVAFTTSTAVTMSYRLRTFCSNSNEENFSTVVTYTTQECYLVPSSGNNSITTCSGILYDHGGPTGDYANSVSGFTVINPGTPGFLVTVSGTTAGETCCDFLRIYDGVGIGGTLLWQGFAGAGAVPVQTSSTGPLTVQFTSDGSVVGAGFALNISCEAPCFGPADPGFGANEWVVTAYNGRDVNLVNTNYRGFYTEPALSYNTQTSWGPLLSPSAAPGYTGCSVSVENHTVVARRQGVPTPGVYQLDVTNHDDEYLLLVNGAKSFENNYANIAHIGTHVGYFDGSTQFEMRHGEIGGESKHALTFTQQNLSATVTPVNPTSCATPNGTITLSNPTGAVASQMFKSTFDNANGLTLGGSANVNNGVLNLIPNVNTQFGTAILTNQVNANASQFRAEFDFRIFDGGGADGISFNYAPSYPAVPVYGTWEQGYGNGLSVCLITFSGAGGPLVRIRYNGTNVGADQSVSGGIRNTNYRQCVVSVNAANQITVAINGVNVITNRQLPAEFATTDKSNWQFAFAGRTGGENDNHRLDNVVINAFNQYQYSIDGNTWTSNPVFSSLGQGTYTPQLRNLAFPAHPVSLTPVTLTNPAAPSGVSAGNDFSACGSTQVVINGTGPTGNFSYAWSGPNIISGGSTLTPTVAPVSTSTYTLTVTNTDNGCSTSDDAVVTLAATCAQLQANFCGISNVTMDMPIRAVNLNAPAYRFKITGPNNGGPGWNNNVFILDRPNRDMRFELVPGSLWASTYSIEVAIGDGMGNWGPYGVPCTVTLVGIPTTQLEATSCNILNVDPNTNLLAITVTSATGYRYRVNGANVNNVVVTKTMGGGAMRKLKMNQVAGVMQGETYTVEVAIRDAAGNWGAYGPICEITVAGAPDFVINNNVEMIQTKNLSGVAFGVTASHNPFTTTFGLQLLNANDTETINVSIYDMGGKLIERHAIKPMDIEAAQFGSNLASGMYMVEVRQGSNQALVRQVKN